MLTPGLDEVSMGNPSVGVTVPVTVKPRLQVADRGDSGSWGENAEFGVTWDPRSNPSFLTSLFKRPFPLLLILFPVAFMST